MNPNLIAWSVFALFVACALGVEWHSDILDFTGALGGAKGVVWLAFLGFTAYSIYCSTQENIFRTIRSMAQLHWGRQIGIDLYLGLALSLSIIFLHQGPIALLLWVVPVLLFANLATLLYVAIHFDSLVARFVA